MAPKQEPETPRALRSRAGDRQPPQGGLRWSTYNVWVDHEGAWHVHNGVSGAITEVDYGTRAAIDTWVHSQIPPAARFASDIEALIRDRILVPRSVDERVELESRFVRSTTGRDHLGLTVVTSMGCNFDCPYCFEHKTPAKLRTDVTEAVLDLFDSRRDEISTCSVIWYGGEPLLAPDQLVDLSTELSRRCAEAEIGYGSMVLTNGWHLDATMAKRLADADVHDAQITIDGPPDIHDRMRPHLNGKPTFGRIVENIVEAVEHLPITIRVNADRRNVDRLDELLQLLAAAGLAGQTPIALGHILPLDHNPDAPSATYDGPCMSLDQFGDAELAFDELARSYGFTAGGAPQPLGSPCTAVKSNELIVGPDGELWKCLDDAGDHDAQIGTIFDLSSFNHRAAKWFAHDPFSDDECRDCIALPVCMGGCALIGRLPALRDNRCSTFRTHHVERIRDAVALGADRFDARVQLASLAQPPQPVAVTIGARP